MHVERSCTSREIETDLSETKHQKALAFQRVDASHRRGEIPATQASVTLGIGEAAGQGKHHGERVLRHRRVPQASTPADPDMVRQVEFKHVVHTGAAHLEPAQRLRACTGRGDGARERTAGADEGFAVREKTALFLGCRGEPERHRGKALGKVPQRTFRRIADEQSGQGVAHLSVQASASGSIP